ncbi:hypothetical protein [Plantactinospora sp. KBS50]|uniref:hypothetical protein n=1 Tax=Plantactinospora sp. KBS50 TaxID=2024580 RepID=UPI000BAB1312|nr:hypothetical protein [Plantactinospora sp. KBS50]ASW55693.1 hypothetical protein CIK06_18190 [Plantactinospora sp. KBS50]
MLAEPDDAERIILAVDFDATGRPEARFSDLAARLKVDCAFWETTPPGLDVERTASGPAYIEHWWAAFQRRPRPVAAVMGFCGGAVYAAALSERVAAWQGSEPQLLLFDPEIAVPQTLVWQFHKIVGYLAGVLPAEDIQRAQQAAQDLYDGDASMVEMCEALVTLTLEMGDVAFAQAGLGKPLRDELMGTFCSFLRYLTAAAELDPLPRWRIATAFQSVTELSGLHAVRTSGIGGDGPLVGREIAVDDEHAKLLANDEVAAAVAGLLTDDGTGTGTAAGGGSGTGSGSDGGGR